MAYDFEFTSAVCENKSKLALMVERKETLQTFGENTHNVTFTSYLTSFFIISEVFLASFEELLKLSLLGVCLTSSVMMEEKSRWQ